MKILQLNDMRSPKIEYLKIVAKSHNEESLIKYMKNEMVERYKDGQWNKYFRKDGPLEWYNPPFSNDQCIADIGSPDDWAEQARHEWHSKFDHIMEII